MLKCPHCNFLSDPKTGDIFDARFPCPKCGKKTLRKKPIPIKNLRAANCSFNPKGFSGFDSTSKSTKLVAIMKTFVLGWGFYFALTKLNEIDEAADSRNRKLKTMLGEMLPALKKANYLVPALAVPEIMTVVGSKRPTTNTREFLGPIIKLIYQISIIYAMVSVASLSFTEALDTEPEFV